MPNEIRVTKSFLPPLDEYQSRIRKIWESGHLTNNGENVRELEVKLSEYLDVKHLWTVSNGTLALQVAFKALTLTGEVITTPFSYVATVSSLVWEGLKPVFVDINRTDFCIDPSKIEAAITENTSAILATHVYGHPCNVKEIQRIAEKHNLKVVYDAAHAFGVKVKGKSILEYGDISTVSFHATKVFHTAEGGVICTPHKEVNDRVWFLRNFGHNGPEDFDGVGINAKMSEFHAAMGNCVLPYMETILAGRKEVVRKYDKRLLDKKQVYRFVLPQDVAHNYSYYPVLIESEELLLKLQRELNDNSIFPRRYFYPSLNKLGYLTPQHEMPVSEDISKRILCLPLYAEMEDQESNRVIETVLNILD